MTELKGFSIDIFQKDGTDFEQSMGERYLIIPSVDDFIETRCGTRKVVLREFVMKQHKVTLTVVRV